MGTLVAVTLLVGVLGWAVLTPRGLPEIVAAAPAAALVLALGLLSPTAALDRIVELGPTVGFLAAILVLAHLAQVEGVFRWLGSALAAAGAGRPRRLLVLVFAVASGTTAVLSLDATVVLLTPVVLATAALLRLSPRPASYACAHLSNTASLLLPVSNLTNLLAFAASGLTFTAFAATMALPWVVAIGVELLLFLLFFRRTLATPPADARAGDEVAEPLPAPRFALAVLAATLVGFAAASPIGVEPVWVAVLGAVVLGARSLATRRTGPRALTGAAAPGFCLFVFALAIVVEAAVAGPIGDALAAVLPSAPTLLGLLTAAGVAAVLANLLNNLPATLALLAALGPHTSPGIVLAVLLGVNIGPNLTYVGSLATLLWRRVTARGPAAPTLGEFTLLGLLTVPITLAAATVALWVSL